VSAIDISKLSYEELVALTADAQKRLSTQREAHRAEVVQRIYTQVLAAGFTLDDVLPDLQSPVVIAKLEKAAQAPAKRNKSGKVRVKLPMKYQNPADAKAQWSGKGRLPAWAAAHVAAGGKLEDLLIQK